MGGRCWTRPIGGILRNYSRRIREPCEIHQAVKTRRDDSHGSKSQADYKIPDVVEVAAGFPVVFAVDPGNAVGKLNAALIDGIECPEVVPKRERVG